MGTFMKKDELLAEAERLGVNIEGLTWPQQQKAVIKAKTEAGESAQYGSTVKKQEAGPACENEREYPVDEREPEMSQEDKVLNQIRGRRILLSPEMAATKTQLFKYDEVLGDELDIEEVRFGDTDTGVMNVPAAKNEATGTYRIKGSTGRKVIAQSTLPKLNAGIEYVEGRDFLPVVTWSGRRGYLYTHHRLPNFKALLMESGYYQEYKSQLVGEPNIWHSAGKLMTVDISLAHHIIQDIQRKEAIKRERGERSW